LADSEKLSLYHAVAEGGYEAAVLGTYAVNFPFYERVVLRRLQAAGCRHNILIVDGGQCGRELASPQTSPQFCGSDYLLLPVQSAASFHPKFVMLLGKRGGRLILGSHNVTLAGFGLNREISTALTCAADGTSAAYAQNVWQFVRAWSAEFPEKIRDVIAATERIAPWLVARNDAPATPVVFGSEPSGKSLWENVRPQLGARVGRVTVISPYFDAKLAFIKRLETELQPKECVVAVHPKFSDLPANARTLSPRTRFVDVSGLDDGWAERCPHAKLYRFELANGRSVVVLGSANASTPAWLADGGDRNAELVVVHHDAEQLWKRLGLHRISTAPEVGKEGWSEIRTRKETKKEVGGQASPSLAIATSDGFVVDDAFVTGVKAESIQVVTADTLTAAIQAIRPERDGALCVCASEDIRAEAIRLEVTPASGTKRVALVHHVSDLLDKAAGTIRQAFRRALAGMEGDPEQLMALMKLVDRAIFDEEISLETAQQSARPKSGKAETPTASAEPDTLVISAKDTARARRRRRLTASSDLALIIDLLIYRLGKGLYAKQETDSPDSVAQSEETLRDQDSEPPEIDGHVLAKACRGKVNRLFRRMIGQCEAAVKRGKDATTPLVQMAAVLGIVRHLRARQATFAWLPKGERLVDLDHEWDFFKDASRCLYASRSGLAGKALAEHDGHEFDELTAVRGLLTWLAFDCELDTRNALDDSGDEPDLVRDNLVGVAYLLPVITECTQDDFAEDVLSAIAAEQQDSMKKSTTYHMAWARGVAKAFRERQPATGPIALGDLVLPLKMSASWPLIVIDPQYNKTGVVDLDTGEPKYFGAGYVARLQGLRTGQ
jgi:hypothetical protein